VQRQDVRVLQVGGGPDLGEEAIRTERRSEVGVQDLHRDSACVPDVLGQVDSGHAALTELTLDAVSIGKRC
jgi:hypothetical protein